MIHYSLHELGQLVVNRVAPVLAIYGPHFCRVQNLIFLPPTMHIKQITISNFRSFRQQDEIMPFHPGTNSVVGRNGSGKSNLFDAVQFVLLSPRFYTLRTVRRKMTLTGVSFSLISYPILSTIYTGGTTGPAARRQWQRRRQRLCRNRL